MTPAKKFAGSEDVGRIRDFSDLSRLATGHVEARIIQVAVELGIFDALDRRPARAGDVAARLATDGRATTLLLNALAALDLVRKKTNVFSLSPIASQFLVRSSPRYLGEMILFDGSLWNCWGNLANSVRSGAPARTPDMYQKNPAETEVFIRAMDSLVRARGDAEALARALDWRRVMELLDVGAGPGTYPIALCRRFSHLQATIFDLPGTLRITRRYVRRAGLTGRIRLLAGDYRTDPVPGRYDLVFLSNIIHGESEPENRRLFGKLAGCLNPGGRLVVKDHILDESRTRPPVGATFSLLMLLTTAGGRCYSFGEVKRWMTEAGLSQVHRVDLPPPLTSSLAIGVRPIENQRVRGKVAAGRCGV